MHLLSPEHMKDHSSRQVYSTLIPTLPLFSSPAHSGYFRCDDKPRFIDTGHGSVSSAAHTMTGSLICPMCRSCLPEAKYHHLVGERESTMGGGAIQTAPGPW